MEIRRRGLRLSVYGLFAWLLALPLAVWAGVRAPAFPAVLTGLTLLAAAYTSFLLRRPVRSGGPAVVISFAVGSIVVLCSGWLGPFVLGPLAACACAVMVVIHSARPERPWLIAVWALIALLPFAVELLGLVPPAYSFRPGELVLHARGLELPPGPTLAALAYTSVSFLSSCSASSSAACATSSGARSAGSSCRRGTCGNCSPRRPEVSHWIPSSSMSNTSIPAGAPRWPG